LFVKGPVPLELEGKALCLAHLDEIPEGTLEAGEYELQIAVTKPREVVLVEESIPLEVQ
jgi:hypothetical protein